MSARDAPAGMSPPVERDGGVAAVALSAAPERGGPADPWRDLATLAALMAVWNDLSLDVRRRIACDAMIAMTKNEPGDEPRL